MRKITADYIYPVNIPPIKNGVIHISDDGEIIDIFETRNGDEEYYQGIICPGFINVHCHTELSFAKNKIKRGIGIDNFISELEKLKISISDSEKKKAIFKAIDEMAKNGIIAVGDIMNTDLSSASKDSSIITFYNFIEVFGSQANNADKIWSKAAVLFDKTTSKKNIIPHAPYSLSEELFHKVYEIQKPESTICIHHLESDGEIEYFKSGKGLMADRFLRWGLKIPNNIPSGKSPLETIGNHLIKNNNVLLIHNTFISENDIDFANKNFSNTYYGLCPNANLYIENKLPPVDLLRTKAVNICIGTDSLASNSSLSIIDEMKVLKAKFDIPNQELIKWATLNGAEALGFDNKLGSIEKGKKPALVLLNDKLDFLKII